MIQRSAQPILETLAQQFKAVAIIGPRQSGKTTLARLVFPDKIYVNFENPDTRMFAIEDPRGFLSNYPSGAIFDEAQRVPELFSYLQQILDESSENGLFIITGSNNFLLQESISQSLAGRVAYLSLLPLSLDELKNNKFSCNEIILKGAYPSIHTSAVDPQTWYANYIRTYIERDVRLIKIISNLITFERFLRLCAGRVGQLLNMQNLAVEVGVDAKTIHTWVGILESTFIAFRFAPYHQNFNKRVIKMPKLYFYDTGIAAALLGIETEQQVELSPFKGALFENLILVEMMKQRLNQAKIPKLYFWRDSAGNEVDIVSDQAGELVPIEVKSGQTVTSAYFKGLNYWNKITGTEGGYVVYAGQAIERRTPNIMVLPFDQLRLIQQM